MYPQSQRPCPPAACPVRGRRLPSSGAANPSAAISPLCKQRRRSGGRTDWNRPCCHGRLGFVACRSRMRSGRRNIIISPIAERPAEAGKMSDDRPPEPFSAYSAALRISATMLLLPVYWGCLYSVATPGCAPAETRKKIPIREPLCRNEDVEMRHSFKRSRSRSSGPILRYPS